MPSATTSSTTPICQSKQRGSYPSLSPIYLSIDSSALVPSRPNALTLLWGSGAPGVSAAPHVSWFRLKRCNRDNDWERAAELVRDLEA